MKYTKPTTKKGKEFLRLLSELHADWFNNFLTIEAFADHYGFTDFQANGIIDLARKLDNDGFGVVKMRDTKKLLAKGNF